jgi:ribose transport system substrate-binding protein
MKRLLKLVIVGLTLTGFSFCFNATAEKTAKPKKFVITLIAKSSTNPVFLASRTGAEAAAKDLSKKLNMDIVIDWRTPPTEDGQVQAQRIAQSVNEGTNAIIISCSDAAKVTGAINDAVNRGVPVMTFDSDAPQSKRFAFYGVNDQETGASIMDTLAKQLGDKGNVAILAGNQNALNLRNRVNGVKEEAKKYPNIKIIGTFYHLETPQDSAAEVVRVMNAYPDIDGWAMVGGWPLFTKTLLKDLEKSKVKIVAIDALPAQLPYVEAGIAPVLLAQSVYNWGYVSVEKVIDKCVLHKDVPVINKMQLFKVDKSTLGEWARKLKAWGFNDVPQKYIDMK